MSDIKEYTPEEVAKHNHEKDCWIIIGNSTTGGPKVYDVTKYLDEHPGGSDVVLEAAGKDADDMFEATGHSNEARTILKKFLIGTLKEDPEVVAARANKKTKTSTAPRTGLNPYAVLFLLVAIAAGIFLSQQGSKSM